MAEKRFGDANAEEIQQQRENIQGRSTQKANLKASRTLKAYLRSRGENDNFETLLNADLNEVLTHFYINVRRVNGEKYKTSSLENLRFV